MSRIIPAAQAFADKYGDDTRGTYGSGLSLTERAQEISDITRLRRNYERTRGNPGKPGLVHLMNAQIAAAEIEHRDDHEAYETAKRGIESKYDEIKARVETCRAYRLLSRERASKGFSWFGGKVGEQHFKPFDEVGFKSASDPVLLTFTSKLPKGRYYQSIRKGVLRGVPIVATNNKKFKETHPSKILALDCGWIETNPLMRGCIRVDVDESFETLEELLTETRNASCPDPNIIVGTHSPEGRIVRPHLYYILEDSVCWTERGRQGPKDLFRAAQRALTRKLAHIGADANAHSNPLRGKNPLSVFMDTFVVCETLYMLGGNRGSKTSLAGRLRLDHDDWKRGRMKEGGTSNLIYSEAKWAARDLIGLYHPSSTKVKRTRTSPIDKREVRAAFTARVIEIVSGCVKNIDAAHDIEKTCLKVVAHFWETYSPRKANQNRDRGAMRRKDDRRDRRSKAAVRGYVHASRIMCSTGRVKAQKRAGASYAAAIKAAATVARLVDIAVEQGIAPESLVQATGRQQAASPIDILVEVSGMSRGHIYRIRVDVAVALKRRLRQDRAAECQAARRSRRIRHAARDAERFRSARLAKAISRVRVSQDNMAPDEMLAAVGTYSAGIYPLPAAIHIRCLDKKVDGTSYQTPPLLGRRGLWGQPAEPDRSPLRSRLILSQNIRRRLIGSNDNINPCLRDESVIAMRIPACGGAASVEIINVVHDDKTPPTCSGDALLLADKIMVKANRADGRRFHRHLPIHIKSINVLKVS